MINRQEDNIEYLGTTILIVLCFLLFIAFHQNSNKSVSSLAHRYQSTTLLTPAVESKNPSELCSQNNFNAPDDKINLGYSQNTLK